jgi:Ion channel
LTLQIILGSMMVIVTTIIQSGFTVVVVRALRRRVSKEFTRSLWRSTLMLALFVLWLFLATILEVWTWALLYLALDAVTTLEEAAYFSMETFTTLGYGDITLDKNWRLLSSFEGANGLLMFGWSTALVFAAIQWIYRTRTQAPS